MTPETRAARDRIAAYLDARAPWARAEGIDLPDSIAYLSPPFDVQLGETDLRLLLDALDQQPDHIIISDAELTKEQVENLKRRFLAAQDGHRPARILNKEEDPT